MPAEDEVIQEATASMRQLFAVMQAARQLGRGPEETLRNALRRDPGIARSLRGLENQDVVRAASAAYRDVREQAEPAPSTLADRPSRDEAARNPDAYRDWQRNGVVPTPEEMRAALDPGGAGQANDLEALRGLRAFTDEGRPGPDQATGSSTGPQTTAPQDQGAREGRPHKPTPQQRGDSGRDH